jgi:cell division protein FtsZ
LFVILILRRYKVVQFPKKTQLGVNLTEGLGAGANPDVGQQSAIESIAEIEKMLDRNTKMVLSLQGWVVQVQVRSSNAQLAKNEKFLGIVTLRSYLKVKFVRAG